MTTVARVIRADIQAMTAYPVEDAQGMVKLDAMENPYTLPLELRRELARLIEGAPINRYPDPQARALKDRLRQVMGIPSECELILGNGSDEIIAILINAVAGAQATVMTPSPGFAMFKMSTIIARANFVGVPLETDFSLNAEKMLAEIRQHQPSIIFLAYPNNPTGNLFDLATIERILENAPGLVVIDEAYQVFAGKTCLPLLSRYPNLVVMRTLSKLGLAGLRLGYAAARPDWIREFDKVRGPYNVGVLTQLLAERILASHGVLEDQAAQIVAERERLFGLLRGMPRVTPFPSAANFILLRVPDANKVFEGLRDHGILVRNLHGATPLLDQCVRFTVGTRAENDQLMDAFSKVMSRL